MSTAVLDAATPFPVLVAQVQLADRARARWLWIAGPRAVAVAARLQRLVREVRIGVALEIGENAADLARDVLALAGANGGQADVRVLNTGGRDRLIRAIESQGARGGAGTCAHFGGDAFAATLRLAEAVRVTVDGREVLGSRVASGVAAA